MGKLLSLVISFFSVAVLVGCAIPDRRTEMPVFDSGHIAFPVYANVPGLGSAYGAGILSGHLFGTSAKASLLASGGDMSVLLANIGQIHLIEDMLVVGINGYSTKFAFVNYARGAGSKNDVYYYTVNKEYGGGIDLNFHVWERRIQLNSYVGQSKLKYDSIINSDETEYANMDDDWHRTTTQSIELRFDLTDHVLDPHEGVRLQVIQKMNPIQDDLHARFYTLNEILTGYVPVGESTWAWGALHSRAHMLSDNNLSQAQLQAQMGLNCSSITDPTKQAECTTIETARIQDRLTENQTGTAQGLGGPMTLRGYELDRFRGRESIFFGTEFRWNVWVDEGSIDYWFIKGDDVSFQIAPFYEVGTVSDRPDVITQASYKQSYGLGLRLGISGLRVRADFGMSEEGSEVTVFAGYPWDLSPF